MVEISFFIFLRIHQSFLEDIQNILTNALLEYLIFGAKGEDILIFVLIAVEIALVSFLNFDSYDKHPRHPGVSGCIFKRYELDFIEGTVDDIRSDFFTQQSEILM
jgi:hypothetical protein